MKTGENGEAGILAVQLAVEEYNPGREFVTTQLHQMEEMTVMVHQMRHALAAPMLALVCI